MSLPLERQLIEEIHRAGGYVRLHICGRIMHLLPQIATLKADIVDPDWENDMEEARRLLGPDTVLTGNLDPVRVVKNGTPEDIHRRVLEIYEITGNPYMIGAGCEIPAGTPADNLKALCHPVPYKR